MGALADRPPSAFDPEADAAERWGDWLILSGDLRECAERFFVQERVALFDPRGMDEVIARAHVVAHLDLGHVTLCGGGAFSDQQEADASGLARLRVGDDVIGDLWP